MRKIRDLPRDSTSQAPEARPFHLLRVECPLIFLSVDKQHKAHRFLCILKAQYVTLKLREPELQPLESPLDLHSLILRPLPILNVLPACHRKPSSNGPMVTAQPIEGDSDCRARPFHFELYFDLEVMQQQPELRNSFGLLQRYHFEHLMTLREFFYPRVALDFYQSMTTQGAQSPIAIHFSIDGCQGILEVRHIAEALHISYEPVNPTDFREWSPVSQQAMVCILSRGTSTDSILLCKELPPGMLLVDVLLRSNLFPLQHLVQRQGAILDALFRISEGFYFGPHHLIMASFLHFKEKVYKKKL